MLLSGAQRIDEIRLNHDKSPFLGSCDTPHLYNVVFVVLRCLASTTVRRFACLFGAHCELVDAWLPH